MFKKGDLLGWLGSGHNGRGGGEMDQDDLFTWWRYGSERMLVCIRCCTAPPLLATEPFAPFSVRILPGDGSYADR